MLSTSIVKFNYLIYRPLYLFSIKNRKISQVGFKTQDIINANELTYLTNQKLVFQNGKCLIYRSKKGFGTTLKRYWGYYGSISTIGFLIYTNPFQAVFPAAIPILWVLELIRKYQAQNLVIKMLFKRYQWNQQIAHQIYLNEGGTTAEIHYADKKRRKLFGQELCRTYYNTIFADPIQRQKDDTMPNSNPFPQKLEEFQKQSLSWSWCKYYSNGQNYVIVPKSYEYIKKDVLLQLFKGKSIQNS